MLILLFSCHWNVLKSKWKASLVLCDRTRPSGNLIRACMCLCTPGINAQVWAQNLIENELISTKCRGAYCLAPRSAGATPQQCGHISSLAIPWQCQLGPTICKASPYPYIHTFASKPNAAPAVPLIAPAQCDGLGLSTSVLKTELFSSLPGTNSTTQNRDPPPVCFRVQ